MNKKGFTLTELIVAVAITGIMMVGMSTFFSGVFRNLFEAQTAAMETQQAFVIHEILRNKFSNLEKTIEKDTDWALIKNKISESILPFTYIGSKDDKLGFKDFVPFVKVFNPGGGNANIFNDPKNGLIKDIQGGNILTSLSLPKNIAGFTRIEYSTDQFVYYIAVPNENKIYSSDAANDLAIENLTNLKNPTDVTTDGTNLFISDSGNGRILKLDAEGAITTLAENLKYPTGLAYENDFLFVSETLKNEIKKLDLSGGPINITTLIDQDRTIEGKSLLLPTGLNVDGNKLYIADSGNSRILTLSDPGHPTSKKIKFSTDDQTRKIKRVRITFPAGTTVDTTPTAVITSTDNKLNALGKWVGNDVSDTAEYQLYTTLSEDTATTNACTEEECSRTYNLININEPIDLFNDSTFKGLKLNNDGNNPFEVASKNSAQINLDNDFSTDHDIDTEVLLTTDIPANTEITMDLSGIDTASLAAGFYPIKIEIFDLDDTPILTRYESLTIGDGKLGTNEDLLEKLTVTDTLHFPTSANQAHVVDINDLSGNVYRILSSDADPTFEALDPTAITTFDTLSSFKISNLNFSEPNSGKILEMSVTIQKPSGTEQTYKISGKQ